MIAVPFDEVADPGEYTDVELGAAAVAAAEVVTVAGRPSVPVC